MPAIIRDFSRLTKPARLSLECFPSREGQTSNRACFFLKWDNAAAGLVPRKPGLVYPCRQVQPYQNDQMRAGAQTNQESKS